MQVERLAYRLALPTGHFNVYNIYIKLLSKENGLDPS